MPLLLSIDLKEQIDILTLPALLVVCGALCLLLWPARQRTLSASPMGEASGSNLLGVGTVQIRESFFKGGGIKAIGENDRPADYCPAANSSVSCSCLRALLSFFMAEISSLTSVSKSFSSCNFLYLLSNSLILLIISPFVFYFLFHAAIRITMANRTRKAAVDIKVTSRTLR